jgi:hypothetical protein
MFIPDPGSDFFPSRIRTVSIPDPGSRIFIKEVKYFNPKKAKNWFLSSKKYDPGCSSRIRMLTFSHPGSRIQGSKRHPIPDPDPQHCFCVRKLFYSSIVKFWSKKPGSAMVFASVVGPDQYVFVPPGSGSARTR